MTNLLSRLQAATEGSAELDRDVLLACRWREELALPYAPFRSPDGELMDRTDTPRPTRRIDHIMRIIAAAGMRLHLYQTTEGTWAAWIVGVHDIAESPTAALACVRAFLRAREAGR